jgi:EAL domain-containing protein (putative c-di-GMP-specific phosphodiesterase class I)
MTQLDAGSRSLPESQLARVMSLARRHLNMDVVYVGQFAGERQIYRGLDGDPARFGMSLGEGPPLEATFCQRMVTGQIPSAIPDTSREAGVADLLGSVPGGVGAYVGVPITLADGSLYGTFCCLSQEPVADLTERDVRFMAMLAELLADELLVQREHDRQRDVLDEIIHSERVELAVQPVVLADGSLVGLEVLSRFGAELCPPDVVFAAARELGAAQGLERMVLSKAVATLLPLLPAGCALGLNATPTGVLHLAQHPAAADFPGLAQLVLEITEHDAVENYEELRDCLRPLRDRGLRIAIDDAGAGYASLHHIIELEPDMLKIDRSIIDGLAGDRSRRGVVRSFVGLAQDIGALVCAEGVEQLDDLTAAIELGVHAAQGYLIARPTTDHSQIATWATQASLLPLGYET